METSIARPPIMTALSMGFGVRTAALGILQAKGELPLASVALFSDTGDESPETYAFAGQFTAWLVDRGLGVLRVRRDGSDMVTAYTQQGIMPMRSARSCTENYKVLPIRRWMRANGCQNITYRSPNRPVVQLGISWDEMHRMWDSDVKWIVNAYPLIDLRLTREDCKKIIAAEGFEVPPKSGCMCCPWQSARAIVRAAERHPDRIERVAVMEERAMVRNPQNRLIRADRGNTMTVRQILAAAKRRIPLFDLTAYESASCQIAGYCHG